MTKLVGVFSLFLAFQLWTTPLLAQSFINGVVKDAETQEALAGVTVSVGNATVQTDEDGRFRVEGSVGAMVRFSSMGYQTLEIPAIQGDMEVLLGGQFSDLDEVVIVGYGTQKASNVTTSVSRRVVEDIEPSDVSIMQTLQGSVPGLNVGQVDQAGGGPSILIRGRASISGASNPLIIVDGIIYRGSLIDLNPNDIETIDVLKDASAAAVYGSQASNGVIILTTNRAGKNTNKPEINLSSHYSFQRPWKELLPQSAEDFMLKVEHSDLLASRTAESGYLERNPAWVESANFKTNNEVLAYGGNLTFDWYDYLTSNNPYTTTHNVSIANQTENSSYFTSIGYTDQQGHMVDEGYSRINARINLSSSISRWLNVDFQSYVTVSDNGLGEFGLAERYLEPFAYPYEVTSDGLPTEELVLRPIGESYNPMIRKRQDFENKRMTLNGNVLFTVNLPIEGLSYRGNFANTYHNSLNYNFKPFDLEFRGSGNKNENKTYDFVSDHILSFQRVFNAIHDLDVTLLYGVERRKNNFTNATGSNFINPILGYNRLQASQADMQSVSSGGWEEASLYNMGRVNYAFKNKYLLTAIIRRDGFSGFSEENKFGYFPSLSLGWVITQEPFFKTVDFLSMLKLRASYGSTGNRTIGRYTTLAQSTGGFGYVSAEGNSIYTQRITSMASPMLTWEKSTGVNIGVDFSVLRGRLSGGIDYYNRNTTDLLYDVDIPSMTGFTTFPDNLGKMHNHGFEIELSSVNAQSKDFIWRSNFYFSKNRDRIVELLGFDNDGDGREDDLISEGLFIGESLQAIYDYKIDGMWQIGDDIPAGYEFGAYKVMDMNNDGVIDQNDRMIVGNREPNFRFSINNEIRYKNWSLNVFVNSVMGGNDYYLGNDNLYGYAIFNSESHFNYAFPSGLDYWTPESPDAKYQRPGIRGAAGIRGDRYTSRGFVRLQNLRLSYNFLGLDRFGINNMRLVVSGRNLFTWTKWPGWDPETGTPITRSGRPVMRSYTAGVEVSF